MEDRIEVGEYVRIIGGEIGRNIKYENSKYYIEVGKNKIWEFSKKFIVKHSKIISEIVEAGDYVNGKLIYKIDKGPNYCYLYYGKGKTFVDYQIKTILTKEKYMANCYKVGGEDE